MLEVEIRELYDECLCCMADIEKIRFMANQKEDTKTVELLTGCLTELEKVEKFLIGVFEV